MAEFVFRNLSVKLFPGQAVAQGAVCVCCSYAHECDDCSLCTDGPTAPPCDPCTDTPTDACGPCTEGVTDPGCGPVTDDGCRGPTDDCFPCTDFDTSPCTFSDEQPCEEPLSCVQASACFEDSALPVVVVAPADAPRRAGARSPRPVDVVQAELDVLRVELRAALGLPPDEDPHRRAPEAPPRTGDEVAQVRAALLAAVDELDGRLPAEGRPTE